MPVAACDSWPSVSQSAGDAFRVLICGSWTCEWSYSLSHVMSLWRRVSYEWPWMTNRTKANRFATSTLPTTLRPKPASQPYNSRQKQLYSPRTRTLLIQCKPKWADLTRLCDDSLKNVPPYAMSGIAFRFRDSPINICRMSHFDPTVGRSFTMKKDGAEPKNALNRRSGHERSIS
jgi:hypothetical protein